MNSSPSIFDIENDEDDFDPRDVEENFDKVTEDYQSVEFSISSYGADYPVDGLVKRLKAGSIYIPPFQRDYVWNVYRASRFIESLLLGLPVPGVFLSREVDSNKMLVIDGQQRLKSLQFYYNELFDPKETKFRLLGVHDRFKGKSYSELDPDDRLRLDDSIIHAIIVKQEEPEEVGMDNKSPSSAYHIFERLNTGGVLLSPQEIRSCVYHGPLIKLLEELNGNSDWRELFGKVSTRMRDRELILRFFALFRHSGKYSKPMKEFLNRFAKTYRNIDITTSDIFSELFTSTVAVILNGIGKKAFKLSTVVNAAVCDSVMIGVANRLSTGKISNMSDLSAAHELLINNDSYKESISSATTDPENVETRINLSIDAFRDIK